MKKFLLVFFLMATQLVASSNISDVKVTSYDEYYKFELNGNFEGPVLIFLDTDNNPDTGYTRTEANPKAIGADYLIEQNRIYKYSGNNSSSEWEWTRTSWSPWEDDELIWINNNSIKFDLIRVAFNMGNTFNYAISALAPISALTPYWSVDRTYPDNSIMETFSNANDTVVTNEFYEYTGALKNPLKGFSGWHIEKGYASIKREYIKAFEVMPSIYTPVDEIVVNIKNFIDRKTATYEDSTIKLIPRIILEDHDNSYCPNGLTRKDYKSDRYLNVESKLIKALGEASDNNPKVAFVQMGILGEYGEFYPGEDIEAFKDNQFKRIEEKTLAAFKNKQVLVTGGGTDVSIFYNKNFGVYWDSFMNPIHREKQWTGGDDDGADEDAGNLGYINSDAGGNRWKSKMIVSEIAYNNDDGADGDYGKAGDGIYLDFNSNDQIIIDSSLSKEIYYNYLIKYIRKYHISSLSWISNYTKNNATAAGAEAMQKAMGYRFVLEEVSYPLNVTSDNKIQISFKVRNDGSAPFYYDWPLEVSLLSTDNRLWVANLKQEEQFYISQLPDDSASETQTYTINVAIPENVSGEYYLSFSIPEPVEGSWRPAVRFANTNYFSSGEHPVGKIGVNHIIDDGSINPNSFDSLD